MADFTLIDVETGSLGEGAAANQRTLSELERLQHEFQTTAQQLVGATVGSSFTAFGDMVQRALPVMQKLDEQLKVGGIDNLSTLQENYESWNLTGQQAVESITILGI
jgi:hypothetical protein